MLFPRQAAAKPHVQSLLTVLALACLAAALRAAAQAPPAPGAQHYTVVLDAAHGGDDPGATLVLNPAQSSQSQQEKQFTLAFSQRLRALLQARGMIVVTTHDSDATVDPSERASIANRARPQLCLSLHATTAGSGVHLYVSALTPAPPDRMLPWKTAQAAFVTRSLALAGSLNSALIHTGVPVTLGRTALPGLDSMACPTVAIEMAPVLASAHNQPVSIGDSSYQTQVANAIAAAVVQWRAEAPQP